MTKKMFKSNFSQVMSLTGSKDGPSGESMSSESVSPIRDASNQFCHQPKQISITTGTVHKFRHAKEMKVGHGGLNGDIDLPPDYRTSNYRIILSVLPASKSTQKIHPCLLHVSIMNEEAKQRRAKYRTKLMSSKDWRVILDVTKGDVFHVPNSGKQEAVRVDCIEDDKIKLGANNLQITIISPLLGTREKEGVKLVDVIKEKLEADRLHIDDTAEEIANEYTASKLQKVNLHMCRIQAQLFKVSFVKYPNVNAMPYWTLIDQDISDDIVDGRDINVGSFDLESISEPNRCCIRGKWKLTLVSKFRTATVKKDGVFRTVEKDWPMTPPVFPVFIITNESNSLFDRMRPEKIWKGFNQIETNAANLTIHGGSFSFKVPPQNHDVIEQIQNTGHQLKIALYRSLDGTYSDTAFNFNYVRHFDGCPFCEIRLGSSLEPNFPAIPPLIPDPSLSRIPPLIPIEYPKEGQTNEGSKSNINGYPEADKNKSSNDTTTDSFLPTKNALINETLLEGGQMKTHEPYSQLKRIKIEPSEDEVDCSDQGKLVIADDTPVPEKTTSNDIRESDFDLRDTHGIHHHLTTSEKDDTVSDEELELKVFPENDSLENNDRSYTSPEDQPEQTKRKRKNSNLKLNIPNHPFKPTLDSEGSVMSTNSTVTPDPYTLQYLSFMSRRAESGLVDFNRYPQQNGNFNVFRPMAPEIGRQLDMNSYSMSTRHNLGMDNNIYQQSDCLSSPVDEYRRSEHPFSNDPISSPDVASINSESTIVSPTSSTPVTPSSMTGSLQTFVSKFIEQKRNKMISESNQVSNGKESRRLSLISISSTEENYQSETNDSTQNDFSQSSTSPLALLSTYRKRMESNPDKNLTPTALYKRNRLRQRNKIAATKCRNKRKAQHKLLILEHNVLSVQNQAFKTSIIPRLEQERMKLIHVLQEHENESSNKCQKLQSK